MRTSRRSTGVQTSVISNEGKFRVFSRKTSVTKPASSRCFVPSLLVAAWSLCLCGRLVAQNIVANPTATQTITAPATGGVIPLQIKGNSTANASLLEIYDSQATPVLQGRFDPTGALILAKAPTFSSMTQGSLPFCGIGGLAFAGQR